MTFNFSQEYGNYLKFYKNKRTLLESRILFSLSPLFVSVCFWFCLFGFGWLVALGLSFFVFSFETSSYYIAQADVELDM